MLIIKSRSPSSINQKNRVSDQRYVIMLFVLRDFRAAQIDYDVLADTFFLQEHKSTATLSNRHARLYKRDLNYNRSCLKHPRILRSITRKLRT